MYFLTLVLLAVSLAFGIFLFATAAGNVGRAREENRLHEGWSLDASGWKSDLEG